MPTTDSGRSGDKWRMEITTTLYVSDRNAWRQWLLENYQTATEIWLITYKKHTGKPSIPYNQAVEQALCFGWIDSIRKRVDDERLAQRFTPRKTNSAYSQTNLERLRRMSAQQKIMPDVLPTVQDALAVPFQPPEDVLAELRADPVAWTNFHRYSESYQRIRLAFIDSARKRPEEFDKRLNNFLKKTAQDKQYGYGIEDYY